jgi:hypothetical protein
VGAPSVHSCGGAEERMGCGGDAAATCTHAVAPVGSASGGGGALRRVAKYSISCCYADLRRFHRDQMPGRDSVARRATFGNWRLAAEHESQMAWSVTTDVVS